MDAKKLLDRVVGIPSARDDGAEGDSSLRNNPPSLLIPAARQRLAAMGAPSGLTAIELLARRAWSDDRILWVAPLSGTGGNTAPLSEEARARLLLRALMTAAKVEGRLEQVLRPILKDGDISLSDEERAFLQEQIDQSLMLDDVARGLTTRAETVEVYAASLLALDPSQSLSRHYLDMLAARLGLERAFVERIEGVVAAAPARIPMPRSGG
jgi:uncharacterized membrane protein YebE (DUF533 family)